MAFDELSSRMEDIIKDKYNYYVGAKSRVDYYKKPTTKDVEEVLKRTENDEIIELVREIEALERRMYSLAFTEASKDHDPVQLAEARTQMNKAKKDLQNDLSAYFSHAEEMRKDHPSEVGWAVAIENEIKSKAATTKATSETSLIRDWANENGYTVSPKGRIPQAVVDAYNHSMTPKTIEVTPF